MSYMSRTLSGSPVGQALAAKRGRIESQNLTEPALILFHNMTEAELQEMAELWPQHVPMSFRG